MREKWWDQIPAQPFTANGTSDGQVTVSSAIDFKVKQRVILSASTQLDLQLVVKRVLSPTLLVVGPAQSNIDTFSDISAYTVARGATIHADAQTRPAIDGKDSLRAAFAEEPANAFRTLPVDQLGNPISASNPLPVTAGGGGLAPSSFDDVKIIKNSNGDPTQYQFFLATVSVGNINVTYDSFGAAEYKKA